jgi:hypothetical protein
MYFRITLLSVLSCVFSTGCSAVVDTVIPTPAISTLTISYPEQEPELSLESDLPGMIRVIGDSGANFVTGTVEVSDSRWLPVSKTSGGKVTLAQTVKTQPYDAQNFTNLWKLRISDAHPFRLTIKNLQAEGHWNFSGLPITELTADCGTTKNAFTFDEPNPATFARWELNCGAGVVIAEGLLNSACRDMSIRGGAGSLTLRFNGKEILQAMKVTIDSGTGEIYINEPPEIPARVEITGTSRVFWSAGFIKPLDSENIYLTEGYTGTPVKSIHISISGNSSTVYLNSPSF